MVEVAWVKIHGDYPRRSRPWRNQRPLSPESGPRRRMCHSRPQQPPASNKSSVFGSGTVFTAAVSGAEDEEIASPLPVISPGAEGSKTNVPPGKTVKLVPRAMAAGSRHVERAGVDRRAAAVGVGAAEDQLASSCLEQGKRPAGVLDRAGEGRRWRWSACCCRCRYGSRSPCPSAH